MTSPSAFLYRYTPGSVGMVRIFWRRSMGRLFILDEKTGFSGARSRNAYRFCECAKQQVRSRQQRSSWERKANHEDSLLSVKKFFSGEVEENLSFLMLPARRRDR